MKQSGIPACAATTAAGDFPVLLRLALPKPRPMRDQPRVE